MWKKIEFAIVLLLLAVLIMMSNHLEEMVSSGRVTGRNPCIVLDSGHGGEDPGKIGVNQAKEKDVNLKIAKKTKERLEKKGWKVVMTREKDVMLGDPAAGNKKIHDMKARVERINKTMPQAAVSIHQNSYQDAQIHGAQVFYYSHSEEGKRMAEVMQKALLKADEEDDEPYSIHGVYDQQQKRADAAADVRAENRYQRSDRHNTRDEQRVVKPDKRHADEAQAA